MLTRVTLERYRGFQHAEVPIGQVTGIIGANSSGKTTILRAVRLACEAIPFALDELGARPTASKERIQVCREATTIVPDPSRLAALGDWRALFLNADVGEGTRARIRLDFDRNDSVQWVELRLVYGRNAQLKMGLDVGSALVNRSVAGIPKQSKYRPPAIRKALAGARPLATLVPAFYGVAATEEYRTMPLVRRQLGSGDQSHIVRNLLARLDAGALQRMNGFLDRALGARIADRTPASEAERRADLVVTYKDTDGALELSTAGAGLVALIAMYAAMEAMRSDVLADPRPPVLLLLDEPEAHLHPRLQGHVGEEIAKVAGEFGYQLLLATHSVEMTNRLGRREDTVLVHVDRNTNHTAALDSEAAVVRALSEFCDLTPFTSLSFLASRRLLFHEGPTDLRVLESCAELYFRNDDHRMRRWREYVPVSLGGVGNVSTQGVLRRVLTPSVFPALADGRTVRAALVLDRDYKRDPKQPELRALGGGFESVEVVWSRHSIESLFLDPPVLASWAAPQLKMSIEELERLLDDVVRQVDANVDLRDTVVDGRVPYHRRPDSDGRMLSERKARQLARKEAADHPAVFQPGKRRAIAILGELRSRLRGTRRHALRGTIVDVLRSADPNQLSDPLRSIPGEVRTLLDLMVGD